MQSYRFVLDLENVVVRSEGKRCYVEFHGLQAAGFTGFLGFTFFPDSNLVRSECVVSTEQDGRAILYHSGLSCEPSALKSISWLDSHDELHQVNLANEASLDAQPLSTRYRTIMAESQEGSLAVFPPPHQYFYPLDFVDNFGLNWYGKGFMDVILGLA